MQERQENPELVALGEDTPSAHGDSYCKRRDRLSTWWDMDYISSRWESGKLIRYYLHDPRNGAQLWAGAHVERNVCS